MLFILNHYYAILLKPLDLDWFKSKKTTTSPYLKSSTCMSTYPLQVQAWQGLIFFTPNMPPIIPYHRTIDPWIIIVASSKSSGHILHLWQDPAGMLLAALPRGRSADLRAFQKEDEEESKDYSNFNDTNELISCCTKRRRQELETAWPIFQVPHASALPTFEVCAPQVSAGRSSNSRLLQQT